MYAQISAEQTLSIARQLIDNEDYALAVQYLGKTVQAKPYMAEPYYLRGLCKMMLGDIPGASADCTSAISLNPYMRDPYRVRGLVRMQSDDFTAALVDFQTGLSLMPDDRTFLYYSAICQNELRHTAESERTYNNLHRLYPKFIPGYTAHARSLLAEKDTLAAVRILKSIPGKGSFGTEPTLILADLALTQNRWNDALPLLDNALKLMPHNETLYINRGIAHTRLGNPRAATADFKIALNLNPDNIIVQKALFGKSLTPVHLIAEQSFLPAIKSAIRTDEVKKPCGMFALSFTHPYDDLHPLTYPYPELSAINASGRFPSPLYISPDAAETPDPEQAIALFSFAENELLPSTNEKRMGRAVAYAMLKNYDSALSDLDKVVAEGPQLAAARMERAFVYACMADMYLSNARHAGQQERLLAKAQHRDALTKALADLQAALARDPNLIYALYDMAIIFTRLGEPAKALEAYNNVIALNPNLPQAYLNRGLLHAASGNKQQAAADWSRAGELGIARAYTLIRRL
ncbi:MAG: tetratricopeptide repeat protein [Prevotella sp.]|nr:tetratricopeptide repeat protein [Prevotella sp.]MCM1074455.1 tetratricopeptide repeat protein [Ruminococcus sp.]